MNIYEYLCSPDIAAHCIRIGHNFDVFEQAVIIAHSGKSLKEKHSAWRELISDYPDTSVPVDFGYNSGLRAYLREYIEETIHEPSDDPEKFAESNLPFDIRSVFIYIPVPFMKGDLVEYEKQLYVYNAPPFWYTSKERMSLSWECIGYPGAKEIYYAGYIEETGVLGIGFNPFEFYKLKYFTGELKNAHRALAYISQYIKDGSESGRQLVMLGNNGIVVSEIEQQIGC